MVRFEKLVYLDHEIPEKNREEIIKEAHDARFVARTPLAFLKIPYIGKAKKCLF